MFRKYKRKGAGLRSAPITRDALLDATAGMADAVIEEHETKGGQKAVIYYLHTIIDRVSAAAVDHQASDHERRRRVNISLFKNLCFAR